MSTTTVYMKRKDTRPFLDIKLKTSSTEYADLSISGTTVYFNMKDVETNEVILNRQSCEILIPTTGSIRYVWTATDLVTAGVYLGEFEVNYPSDEVGVPDAKITYPLTDVLAIVVLEDYDNA